MQKKQYLFKGLIGTILFFSLCFVRLSFASDEKGGKDEWFAKDKAKHVTVSCAISFLSFNYYKKNSGYSDTQAKTAAFLTTMAVGAVKEFTDKEFSWKDMGANALGASVGLAVSVKF